MALSADERARIQDRLVNDLKQACLDLSSAAGDLFDRFEEHGLDAAWEGDGVMVVMRMQRAHEELRSFLLRQATHRLVGLGVSPERLLMSSASADCICIRHPLGARVDDLGCPVHHLSAQSADRPEEA